MIRFSISLLKVGGNSVIMATTEPKEDSEITSLKNGTLTKAEHSILQVFPQKIKELGEVLEGPMFSMDDLSRLHCGDFNIPIPPSSTTCNGVLNDDGAPGSKKRKLDNDEVCGAIGQKITPIFNEAIPCNSKLEAVVDYIKPEIISVIKHCSNIKLWIQLMIPKIEDGNNFGVSIQEDILSEVTKAESDSSSFLDQTTRYFSCRGKMLSKLAKYPHLNDYRRAINEYDEKVFFSFHLILTELRNIYVVLYDVILKNYQKLKTPRTSNSTSLY